MAEQKKRYWVYSHDLEGNLVQNIADEDFLVDAIDEACEYITTRDSERLTVRVVDQQADSTTVWIAGPGNRILTSEQAREYEDEDRHSVQT